MEVWRALLDLSGWLLLALLVVGVLLVVLAVLAVPFVLLWEEVLEPQIASLGHWLEKWLERASVRLGRLLGRLYAKARKHA